MGVRDLSQRRRNDLLDRLLSVPPPPPPGTPHNGLSRSPALGPFLLWERRLTPRTKVNNDWKGGFGFWVSALLTNTVSRYHLSPHSADLVGVCLLSEQRI